MRKFEKVSVLELKVGDIVNVENFDWEAELDSVTSVGEPHRGDVWVGLSFLGLMPFADTDLVERYVRPVR